MEERTHSPDEELRQLRQQRFSKVIPRILRPLKTQGRSLQPVLVHGDLWEGNVAIDKTTGRPVIFDACPCYAHNEYELAPWWVPRHKIARDYVNKYAQLRKPSEPAEDFEDHGLVYCLFEAFVSSLHPNYLEFRKINLSTNILEAMSSIESSKGLNHSQHEGFFLDSHEHAGIVSSQRPGNMRSVTTTQLPGYNLWSYSIIQKLQGLIIATIAIKFMRTAGDSRSIHTEISLLFPLKPAKPLYVPIHQPGNGNPKSASMQFHIIRLEQAVLVGKAASDHSKYQGDRKGVAWR
ncbi:hypothetical protein MGG_08952 [Pyricularia oryzae 70-15]|uniref:protein-ribulosamine 3-kinase n=1 Tax=Pyricularia oryzae (strain 70-15 / ATCC MYA-4617 / FGSC 8958) TaxID=242507 RepID=G4MW30_PYRO7|nr:uncharacterized protein MGG_08952 [Pyricularia oryzae 70-15]EHA54183.1 hypothetical protein MGG_08952 [Pyricularia oryzae 70-15]